jgi:glycosyltransferase involved in cell wall biosynthesis
VVGADHGELAAMKVLFLADSSPIPPTTGGRERDLHLARALAAAMDLELVTLGPAPPSGGEGLEVVSAGPSPSRARSLATSLRVPYQVRRHTSRALRRYVDRGTWNSVHASHAFTVPSALRAGVPVVMDAHNLETEVARAAVNMESGALRRSRLRWEARKMNRFERGVIPRAAVVTATSDADADAMRAYGAREIVVVANGVDCASIPYRLPPSGAGVVFVGSYDYLPNAAAARELVDDVMPRLRASVLDATLTLVGRQPPPNLAGRETPWLHIAGEVPDLSSVFSTARVSVMPIRGGGGTRLKVLGALAAGVPVVSTPFGVAGLGLVPDTHVLLGDSADDLAEQAGRIIGDDTLARRLSEAGRREVERRFDWPTVAAPLVAVHERLARGG